MRLARRTFLPMLQSPLRGHLTRITLWQAQGEDLLQLHGHCSHVEALNIVLDGGSVVALTDTVEGEAAFYAHAWPSSLRSLSIKICGGRTMVAMQRLLTALPLSASGLQSLTLKLELEPITELNLTPLLQLPHLTRFSLVILFSLLPSQLNVVKQMRSLTDLDGCESVALPALLLDGPHQLQRLQKFNMRSRGLDVATMQALLTLPCLTELTPHTIDPRCFSLLSAMSRLRTAHLIQESQPGGSV
jgi:hypothetical protein